MANLGTLTLDIIAKIGGFTGPLSQAERESKKQLSSIQSSFKKTSTQIAASLTAAAAALSYYVTKSNHYADESVKAAQKAGMTVEAFTGLAFVADLAGLNAESFTGAMIKLNKALGEASVGSAEQLASFMALGVSIKDAQGNVLSADKVLVSLADKFASMPDGVNKTAMAIKIFGKAGAEMIPFLNGGSASIKELITLAQDLGVVIGEEQAKKAEQFNDSLTILSYASKGLTNKLSAQLLPSLNTIVGVMIDYSKNVNKSASSSLNFQDSLRGVIAFAIQSATAVANVYRAVYALGKMGALLAQGQFGDALKVYRETTAENLQATADAKAMAQKVLSGASEQEAEASAKKLKKYNDLLLRQKKLAEELAKAEQNKRDTAIAKAKAQEEELIKEYEWQKKLLDLKVAANEIDDVAATKEKIKYDEMILAAQRTSLEVQIKNAKEEKDKVKSTADYWETYKKGSRDALEAQYILQEKLDAQNEKEVELSKQMMEIMQQKTVSGGFKAALRDYYESAKNIGTAIENMTTKAFQNMEDAIIKFAQTGKLSFTDMANSIIADMMRIAIQQTITAPLANAMFSYFSATPTSTSAPVSGFNTNAFNNVTLSGRASGGSVSAHGTYLIGENGPELLSLGNNQGFVTPNTSLGSSQPNVVINIENNTGAKMSASQSSTSFDGKSFVINAVVENIQTNGVLRNMLGAR